MNFSKTISQLAIVALAACGLAATANAQQNESLWGGAAEWGGNRQMVSFSPQFQKGQIIVSFGDRRLYHVVAPGQAMSYPIAIPREQSRWEGTTQVSQKRENPSWTPTPEMIRENPRLPSWVPGGHPMNPLGVRAMYLGSSTYRIHGTDAPWTIGQAVSKGCIRMFNQDVQDLYPKVAVGTRVQVTWQRFKTGPGDSVASAEPPRPEPKAGRQSRSTEARMTEPRASDKSAKADKVAKSEQTEKAEQTEKPTGSTARKSASGVTYEVAADATPDEERAARRKAILAKYMAQRQTRQATRTQTQKSAAVE